MGHSLHDPVEQRPAWNAGRKLGAKRPLKPKEIWEIRFMLDREHRLRDRALFDLAIDSKLRGCDLVKVRIGDLVSGGRVRNQAMVVQQKTKRPVQFELLEPARSSLLAWLERRDGSIDNFAFPSRIDRTDHQHSTICKTGRRMGQRHRASARRLRNAFSSTDQGCPNLQTNWESSRGSDFARTFQDREHRALPRRRYRGCVSLG